jgi:type III secretion protein Q
LNKRRTSASDHPSTPANGWRPPRLPRVEAREARLARLCHGEAAARIAQRLGHEAPTFSVCGTAKELRGGSASVLRLSHPAGVASVVFDLSAFPELALLERQNGSDVESGDPTASSGGAALRRTVLRALAAPLLERLAYIGLGDFDVLELVRGEGVTPPPRALALRVTWRHGRQTRGAQVWMPDALVDALMPELEAPADTALPVPALRIPGRIVLGARTFSIAGLNALEPGDIVLNVSNARPMESDAQFRALELAPFSCHAAWGTVGLMCATAHVRVDGHQLTLMESPTMTEDNALQGSQTLPGHALGTLAADAELASLDIPVSFEIDTVALPLGELSGLAPGYVIELAQRAEQVPLRLVAYGRTIGSGELVAVGERLGVRILTIAHHHPQGAQAPAAMADDGARGSYAGASHAAV